MLIVGNKPGFMLLLNYYRRPNPIAEPTMGPPVVHIGSNRSVHRTIDQEKVPDSRLQASSLVHPWAKLEALGAIYTMKHDLCIYRLQSHCCRGG